MRLHRVHLNPRCKEARRDLADPYQMHATLCRAFFEPEIVCPQGALLWREEPETDAAGLPRLLIQSATEPDWSRLPADWLARAEPGIDLSQKLGLDSLAAGARFRFRLRANPSKTVNGKRLGLMAQPDQRKWLERKASQHGFALPANPSTDYFDSLSANNAVPECDCRISQEAMLTGRQHGGNVIHVYAALFEGQLEVTDAQAFRHALAHGIGHGKVMGLGLLSIAPLTR